MTKGKVLLLGALTAWPLMVPVIGWLFEATGLFPKTAADPPAAFVMFYVLLILTPIVLLALLGFYLIYLFTRPHLSLDWKLVWAAILILGNVFAMPVFWVLHVWKPRHLAPMRESSRFSLLVFAPVLIAFLLSAAFLLPVSVMLTSFTLSELNISLSSAFSYDMWIIGPIFAALVLYLIGKGLHFLRMRGRSPLVAQIATWAVFSAGLFLALWFGITVLGSVGASETPIHIYLRWTALIAAGLTLLAQVLVVPWLVFVSKMLSRVRGLDELPC